MAIVEWNKGDPDDELLKEASGGLIAEYEDRGETVYFVCDEKRKSGLRLGAKKTVEEAKEMAGRFGLSEEIISYDEFKKRFPMNK